MDEYELGNSSLLIGMGMIMQETTRRVTMRIGNSSASGTSRVVVETMSRCLSVRRCVMISTRVADRMWRLVVSCSIPL